MDSTSAAGSADSAAYHPNNLTLVGGANGSSSSSSSIVGSGGGNGGHGSGSSGDSSGGNGSDVRAMGEKYQLLDGLHVWSMSCITASRLTFTFKHGTGATHDVVVDADQADQVDEEEEKEATKEATKSTAGGANGCMGGRRLVARLCGPGADAAEGETKSSGRGGSNSESDDDDDDIDGMCQKLSSLFLPAMAAAMVPRMATVANGEDLSRVLLDLEVHFDRASSLVEEVRMLQESVVTSPSVSFEVVAVEQVGAEEDECGAAPLCNLVVTGTNFEKECKVEMTLGLQLGYPFAAMDVTVDARFGLSDAHVEQIKHTVQVRINTLFVTVHVLPTIRRARRAGRLKGNV
jgi:hypothetical protein